MNQVIEVSQPNGTSTLYGPFRFERTARKAAKRAGLDEDRYQTRDLHRGRNLPSA